MSTSAAKSAAARQNGMLSHGPVTASGKERSSQNARKHNLFTDTALTHFGCGHRSLPDRMASCVGGGAFGEVGAEGLRLEGGRGRRGVAGRGQPAQKRHEQGASFHRAETSASDQRSRGAFVLMIMNHTAAVCTAVGA